MQLCLLRLKQPTQLVCLVAPLWQRCLTRCSLLAGVVQIGDKQKGNIYVRSSGQGGNRCKYQLEAGSAVMNSSAASDLWAAGVSMTAARPGATQAVTVMLTRQAPDHSIRSKKNHVKAVTADGQVLQAAGLHDAAAKVTRRPSSYRELPAATTSGAVQAFCHMVSKCFLAGSEVQ